VAHGTVGNDGERLLGWAVMECTRGGRQEISEEELVASCYSPLVADGDAWCRSQRRKAVEGTKGFGEWKGLVE
jgi:hypothetical protein